MEPCFYWEKSWLVHGGVDLTIAATILKIKKNKKTHAFIHEFIRLNITQYTDFLSSKMKYKKEQNLTITNKFYLVYVNIFCLLTLSPYWGKYFWYLHCYWGAQICSDSDRWTPTSTMTK